jgi:hypothetical protein
LGAAAALRGAPPRSAELLTATALLLVRVQTGAPGLLRQLRGGK